MYRTIKLGSCISVQGKLVKQQLDGRLTVRVGKNLFTGYAVSDSIFTPPPTPRHADRPQLQPAG